MPVKQNYETTQDFALRVAADWFTQYALAHEATVGKEAHAIRNRNRATILTRVSHSGATNEVISCTADGKVWMGRDRFTNEILWGPIEG